MPRRFPFKRILLYNFWWWRKFWWCYFVLWAIFKGNVVLIHIYTYMHTYTYKYSNTQSHLWWWRRTWPSSWWARCPCSARRSREGCGSSGGDHGDNNENHGDNHENHGGNDDNHIQSHKSWGETPRKTFQSSKCKFPEKGKSAFSKSFSLKWDGKLSPKCHFEFFSLLL